MYRSVPISSPYGVEGLVTSPAITPDPALTPAEAPTRKRRRSLPDETGVIVALVVLVAIVGILRPAFLQPTTLLQQLSGAAFIGMLAIGMVFVVCIRDIDLSVGWMFNFSAVIGPIPHSFVTASRRYCGRNIRS